MNIGEIFWLCAFHWGEAEDWQVLTILKVVQWKKTKCFRFLALWKQVGEEWNDRKLFVVLIQCWSFLFPLLRWPLTQTSYRSPSPLVSVLPGEMTPCPGTKPTAAPSKKSGSRWMFFTFTFWALLRKCLLDICQTKPTAAPSKKDTVALPRIGAILTLVSMRIITSKTTILFHTFLRFSMEGENDWFLPKLVIYVGCTN